jgi:hypothetical protein
VQEWHAKPLHLRRVFLIMSRPRLHDDGFLAFLRQKPCCVCGSNERSDPAHIRIGFGAMGKKPDDRFCVPLCRAHHVEQGDDEKGFWLNRKGHELAAFEIAAKFYEEYGGTGGLPRRKKPVKPRKPKEQRAKITQRKNPWPKKPK